MKKIFRLTESDLARLVKRVINEEINSPSYTGGIAPEIIECAGDFGIKKLDNYPNCVNAFTKVFNTGKELTNQEIDLCSDELQKNGIPLQIGFDILGCLLAKRMAKKMGF